MSEELELLGLRAAAQASYDRTREAWGEWLRLQDEHRKNLGKVADYLNAHPEENVPVQPSI